MNQTLFPESEMKISAIAPWFGSKRTLAPVIVQELGEHSAYWEPFCGSMSVLLAKQACRMETVNDLHGDLINLARTIQHKSAGPDLYRKLRRNWMHEDLFRECADRYKSRGNTFAPILPDIIRAFDYFVCAWLGRNGVQGTQSYNQGYCVRYTKNGGHGATRFTSCIESIPAWRRRMRYVTILNRDAFSIIEKIEDANGVVIYVDPPYLIKGAKYVHDFKWCDHVRLARGLCRFAKTRVVVSYYAHPELPNLYPNWTIRACDTRKSLRSGNLRDQENNEVAPEVLIINGPSYAQGGTRQNNQDKAGEMLVKGGQDGLD